jgi:ParB family chromosome partitioning protein
VTLAGIRPEMAWVPIAQIDEPRIAARSSMSDEKMDELVNSMRMHGFTSVIVIARQGDRYEVVAGHRRRIAADRAGIPIVPCLVYPSAESALDAIKYTENAIREDLNPAEEAIWFWQLYDEEKERGVDGVAARIGERVSYVQNRMALLQGDQRIFKALQDGRIGVGVAQQLNRCTDELHRGYLLDQALHSEATAATVSSWIADWKRVHEPATKNSGQSVDSATSGYAGAAEYFTCACCRLKENPGDMRPVQVHTYCIKAVLEPALRQFTHRGDVLTWPQTIAEADALLVQLMHRFPALGADDSSAG